jgi:predicted HTH domain antitoxin
VALAMKLFQSEVLSLGKAAKFANCSISEFSDYLAKAGIPIVNYPPDDLDEELKVLE